jgi:hypothetical protein
VSVSWREFEASAPEPAAVVEARLAGGHAKVAGRLRERAFSAETGVSFELEIGCLSR